MTITAVRIDGRLIHGQVANLWIPKLNITRIMIVDDKVAQNKVEKQGLKLATPTGVKISVLPVEKAAENIINNRYATQNVMIVARTPEPILELVNLGVDLSKVNVGNMSQNDQTKSITKSINVEPKDIEAFEELDNKKIKLTHQMVPDSKEEDFMKLLKK